MSLRSLLLYLIVLNQGLVVAAIEHLLLLGIQFLAALFLLAGIDLLELGLVAEEDLRWMALTYDVEGLLNIF